MRAPVRIWSVHTRLRESAIDCSTTRPVSYPISQQVHTISRQTPPHGGPSLNEQTWSEVQGDSIVGIVAARWELLTLPISADCAQFDVLRGKVPKRKQHDVKGWCVWRIFDCAFINGFDTVASWSGIIRVSTST